MSRADTIAMRDGRETLHVNSEQTGECGGLNLADRRKALGNVRNWAVMLAQLFTESRRQSRRNISVFGQSDCERLGRRDARPGMCYPFPVALLILGHARLGEARYRLRAGRGRKELQRVDSHVVVRGVEDRAPSVGEHKDLGRPTSPTSAVNASLTSLEVARGEQEIEMTPNCRWGQPQPLGQLRRRRWPVLKNGAGHSMPRRCIRLYALGNPSGTRGDALGDFHNASLP